MNAKINHNKGGGVLLVLYSLKNNMNAKINHNKGGGVLLVLYFRRYNSEISYALICTGVVLILPYTLK
jgi:hypothetical protein